VVVREVTFLPHKIFEVERVCQIKHEVAGNPLLRIYYSSATSPEKVL
jgi:hypothetical protein